MAIYVVKNSKGRYWVHGCNPGAFTKDISRARILSSEEKRSMIKSKSLHPDEYFVKVKLVVKEVRNG